MDDLDRKLVTLLQSGISLESRPFHGLAKKTGLDAADVLLRLHRLKDEKIIRQISAIFDPENLGYRKLTAAIRIERAGVPEKAALLENHPAVYWMGERDHAFNFWFSLALPGDSMGGPLAALEQSLKAEKIFYFPEEAAPEQAEGWVPETGGLPQKNRDLDEWDVECIRVLQEDFPLTDEPFRKMAREAGLDEEKFFDKVQSLLARGHLKRFAVQFYSRSNVPAANGLVVWKIPQERFEEIAAQIMSFEEVRACYQAPVYSEFPFGVHTLIEGEDQESCERTASSIEAKIGPWPRWNLPLVREYKRTRPKYFPKDLQGLHERRVGS